MVPNDDEIKSAPRGDRVRAFENVQALFELATMGERRTEYGHRVNQQGTGRSKISHMRHVAHVLRQVRGEVLDRGGVVSADPARLPQGKSRAVSERLVIQTGCNVQSATTKPGGVIEIAPVHVQHMTLLHRNFGREDLIVTRFRGRSGLPKMLSRQLIVADGEKCRRNRPIDLDKFLPALSHQRQRVSVADDALPVRRILLGELTGSAPKLRSPRMVACAG